MYVEFETNDGFSAIHVESIVILKGGKTAIAIKRKKGERPRVIRVPTYDIMAIVKRSNFELITPEEIETYFNSKNNSSL